jgi:hypothetical protein
VCALSASEVSFDNPFFDEITKHPIKFSRPVFFGDSPWESYNARLRNGSATLLKLANRYLAVTCHHVVEAFRLYRVTSKGTFHVGLIPIDPDKFLIDEDAERDLAVLDVTTFIGPHLPVSQFTEPVRWPPDKITEDDTICFGGFPGIWREQIAPGHLRFYSFSSGASEVLSVSDDLMYTTIKISECIVQFNENRVLGELGGISGGPVFSWRKGGLLVAELVGFICEYQPSYDLLRVRRATVLRADGTIIGKP